jgi:hypothetical protein
MIMRIIGIGVLVFLAIDIYGQGCSDAGFCTLNSFMPHADSAEFNSKLKVGANVGAADYSIGIFGSYLEFNRKISKKLGGDIKLTMLSQSGNTISEAGLSDVFLNLNYEATDRFIFTAGAKMPLSDGNKSMNGLALPMDYQSSLGTFDLILGAAYKLRKLQAVVAYQQPLTQNNNSFLATEYSSESPLGDFQSTNQFHRKGDVLVRVSYPIQATKRITITPSLLPIYHLGNDTYIDELNFTREIEGSSGLTLNANVYVDFAVGIASMLQLNLGTPFVVREARPDGLTRSWIVNLEYAVKF